MQTEKLDYFAHVNTLAQLVHLRKVMHFDKLPDSLKADAQAVARKAGQEFHVLARQVIGYADGDTISYSQGLTPITGQVTTFYLNESGHLWVRVTRLKKDGTLGKKTDTFPGFTGGIERIVDTPQPQANT